MTEFNDNDAVGADAIGANYTESQRALRDYFVVEYLVDYNAIAACMRIGYSRPFAVEYAQKFMDEAYVQRKLSDMAGTKLDPAKEEDYNKQRIKQRLLQEAHYRGPGSSHSARVSALANLMKIYGLEAPKKTENVHTHKGGVMAVPGVASLESWESVATQSQASLSDNASIDRT